MSRALIIVALLAVFLAACRGSEGGAVASLDDSEAPSVVEDAGGDKSLEEAVLAFSACMRENGVEDFEDPDFNADGSLYFPGESQEGSTEQEIIQAAFQICQSHLEGLTIERDATDFTEIEDRLLEFASCMRENGFDMPDPDFSDSGSGAYGDGDTFGQEIDPEDPAFQTALESCEHIFEGSGAYGS